MEPQRFDNITYLDATDGGFEGYGPLPQAEDCPSVGSSFLTVDTSAMSFDEGRNDHKAPISPENLTMSSGASDSSPNTPIAQLNLSEMPGTAMWAQYQFGSDIWHYHSADAENLWLPSEESTMANCVMNSFSEQDALVFQQPGYFNMGRKQRTLPDPPLSRAMFANPAPQQMNHHTVMDGMLSWPRTVDLAYPMTIAPSVTFQGTLPSSPASEFEPMTPLKHHRGSSSVFASSPLTGSSSSILTSQWDVEETKYMPFADAAAYRERQSLSYLLRSSQDHSIKMEESSPIESHVSKSGVDCEAVIPQNIYACSVPGCVDKDGKPKRFRRQEHKKRHEKTVHNKTDTFVCWVQTGSKPCGKEFTRRDNLNSHLKKTHGSRKNNQRNSYVATLDEKSEYFDDKWKGKLTADGLPIGHPRWPEVR